MSSEEFVTFGCLDALAHPAHLYRVGQQPYQCPGRPAYGVSVTDALLTRAELALTVTQLLARTEHDPECHPDTGCQCVIGALERELPRCQARDGMWACLSLPHNDDLHVFGRRVELSLTTSGTPTPNTGRMMHVHKRELIDGITDISDQLRELLAYCNTEAERKTYDHASAVRGKAYADVAIKLAAILDGED